MTGKIIAIIILILFSAYFSATETAFTSMNRIKLKTMAGDGDDKAQKVLELGEKYDKLAEGAPTVKALLALGAAYGVDLPICETVSSILYDNVDMEDAFRRLFVRSTKEEFYM